MKADDSPMRRQAGDVAGVGRLQALGHSRRARQGGHRSGALYRSRCVHQPRQGQRLLLAEVLLPVFPGAKFFIRPFPQQWQTFSAMKTPHRWSAEPPVSMLRGKQKANKLVFCLISEANS
jgi:hypothetical protein